MGKEPGFTQRYPQIDTAPLPVEPYISAEIFELEKERVFKRSWLSVGRIDQVREPGDFFNRDLEIGDTKILVVCGEDGQVRAFHNVCQHRGHMVSLETSGRGCKGFVCEFHNWTYGLDGELNGLPDADNFTLDKSELGLREIHCDIWEGNVFINLAAEPEFTLTEFMGDLGRNLAGFPHEDYAPIATMTSELNCNWKFVIDAFDEAYHVIGLHRRSAPGAFNGPGNPFSHLQAVVLGERHWTLSAYANPQQSPTPSAGLNVQYSAAATYVPKHSDEDARATLPEGVNPSKSETWAFDIHQVFPNFSYYTANGWILCSRYWPITVDTCRYETTLYAVPPRTVAERVAMEQTIVMLWDVVLEDLSTVERTQPMLLSGAIDAFQLSDMELGIRQHAHVLAEAINKT